MGTPGAPLLCNFQSTVGFSKNKSLSHEEYRCPALPLRRGATRVRISGAAKQARAELLSRAPAE